MPAVQPPNFLGTPFWGAENRRLVAILRPLLQEAAELGVGIAEEDLMQFEVGFDNALANAEAADWARRHTDELLMQLGTTTRRQVDSIIANWFTTPGGLVGEFIEVPGMTLGDLSTALERVLGFNRSRAQMIARTETTRAFATGARASFVQGGIKKWRWNTRHDEMVCFTKNTLVETASGAISIGTINPGTMVLTRVGYRPVIATSKRLYSGDMVIIVHEGGSLLCTSKHPVWASKQGWLQASDFKVGQSLQMVGNKVSKVVSVKHFNVSDSQNFPSMLLKKLVLSLVSFLGVLMPIDSINLKGNTQIREQKVNAIASHFGFLNIFHTKLIQHLTGALFRKCFTLKGAIAGITTKLSIDRPRADTELFTTTPTLDEMWGASAFLRTKMTLVARLGVLKELAATLASLIFGIRQPAFAGANGITVSYGTQNLELLTANGANFGDTVMGHSALCRTETSAFLNASRGQIKSLPALGAHLVFPRSLSFLWRKFQFCISSWHSALSLTNLAQLYHSLFAKTSIMVYNLEVEGDPTFYAGGVLVHNCPLCAPLNGKVVVIGEEFDTDVTQPPYHPRCRCGVSPVVEVEKQVTTEQATAELAGAIAEYETWQAGQ